jgi:hypothetical protein
MVSLLTLLTRLEYSSKDKVGMGLVVIAMVFEKFWHCGIQLRLSVLFGSTQFVIQQFLPEIGSEMQGPIV